MCFLIVRLCFLVLHHLSSLTFGCAVFIWPRSEKKHIFPIRNPRATFFALILPFASGISTRIFLRMRSFLDIRVPGVLLDAPLLKTTPFLPSCQACSGLYLTSPLYLAYIPSLHAPHLSLLHSRPSPAFLWLSIFFFFFWFSSCDLSDG